MSLPAKWCGADGTEYAFLDWRAVRDDQPRWWVDELPTPGDKMCGPTFPWRLHLLPAKKCCASGEICGAFVALPKAAE